LEVKSKRLWGRRNKLKKTIVVEDVPSEANRIVCRYAIRTSVQTNLTANGFKIPGIENRKEV
jgi:hypothetical protein